MTSLNVGVVGAGIIGLTTALSLLDRGHEVTIITDRYPRCMNVPEDFDSEAFDVIESSDVLVSDVACASFIPHVHNPSDLQLQWLLASSKQFWAHSEQQGTSHSGEKSKSVV